MRFLAWVFLVDFLFERFSVFGSPPIGDPAPSDPPPSGPVRLTDLDVTKILKSQVDCGVGQVRLDPTDESSACEPDRCAGVNCEKNHAKCTVLADGLTGYGANGEADIGNGFSCVLKCHSGWL